MHLTRRDLLLTSLGSLAATRLGRAQTATEKPAVVLIFLDGGYNALFSAADAYVPRNLYGCTSSNVRDLGNGLVVDAGTLGTLADSVLQKMCTVGVLHGASGHDYALKYAWFDGTDSMPLKLADALGGTSPFRCVHFGPAPARGASHKPYNSVVMTGVPDLSAAITLASQSTFATGPRKDLMARALRASLGMSATTFERNPNMLRKTWEGTHTLLNVLEQPPPGVDWAEVSAAYGIPATDTSAVSFTSHLAGAELMVRAGSDVVCITSPGVGTENWDTHGDGTGQLARSMMTTGILPALRVFLERTLALQGRNVVTVLFGEFARTGGLGATDSEHANGISASVFGKRVRPGSTGRFSVGDRPDQAFYVLPPDTPDHDGFRAFIAAAAGAPAQPWGQNPHSSLLL